MFQVFREMAQPGIMAWNCVVFWGQQIKYFQDPHSQNTPKPQVVYRS